MNTNPIAQQALHEHELLGQEVETLRLRLAIPVRDVRDWFAKCKEHVRHFHTQLRKHMEMEESGGFMKPVRERRPTLAAMVQRMLEEHRLIRALCHEIEECMENCRQPTLKDIEMVRMKIDRLLHDLHRHEQDENSLVQEAFTQDIGTGD